MKKLGFTSSEQQIFNAKKNKKNKNMKIPNEKSRKKTVKDKMGKLFKFMENFCFCLLGICELYSL